MQTIYVKFLTEADRVRGFYELIQRASVTSFPGQVYQISRDAVKILEDSQIGYREATGEEVRDAHDQVRNPSAAVL